MSERLIYHSDDSHWYKVGDEPWLVRLVDPGKRTVVCSNPVEAETFFEAFRTLFGHDPVLPAPTRELHREVSV